MPKAVILIAVQQEDQSAISCTLDGADRIAAEYTSVAAQGHIDELMYSKASTHKYFISSNNVPEH